MSQQTSTQYPLEPAIRERMATIPAFETLKVQILTLTDGGCKAIVPKDNRYDGIFKSYHGGMLMTAADTVACLAIMTLAGADLNVATTDMNIRFLGPCLSDVTVDAQVIKFGKSLCPVDIKLYDTDQKLVAIAQVTYMRLPKAPQR
jgi:uncharacterized protein (TIGR00369 family)